MKTNVHPAVTMTTPAVLPERVVKATFVNSLVALMMTAVKESCALMKSVWRAVAAMMIAAGEHDAILR
jgi:hypothetical protein